MRRNPNRRARGGFTLIEILVVIAIIAVLFGMLMAAIMRVKSGGPRVQVTNDLSQMAAALSTFESNVYKGQGRLPSKLMLCEDGNYPLNTQLGIDSKNFLNKCFGHGRPLGQVDWNGNGGIDAGQQFVLEGEQVLVFLLGGINGTRGFSTNTSNPADFSRSDRLFTPFSFEGRRLNTNAPFSPQFPAYNDPYGTPYAFFSSYYKTNGYNRYGSSDCAALGLQPYFTPKHTPSQPDYYYPEGYQIISAGKDKLFGPGGLYPPYSGKGEDDMTNFHQGILAAQ